MRKNEFMKVTRKITAATLIVMTTISLTACGKESSNDTKASLEVIATQIQTEQETEKQSTNTESSTQDNEIVIFDDRSNSEYKDEQKFTRVIGLPLPSDSFYYEYRKIDDGLVQLKSSSGKYDITLKYPEIYEQVSTADGIIWNKYNEYKPDSGMTLVFEDDCYDSFAEFFKKKYGVADENFDYLGGKPRNTMMYRAYVPKASGGIWYVIEYYNYRTEDNTNRFAVWGFESDNSNFKEEFSYIEGLANDICDTYNNSDF